MLPTTAIALQSRTYRPKWWARIFALGFLAFSVAGLVNFWGAWLFGDKQPNLTEILVPAGMVLVGAALAIHYFTTTVTLLPDALEYRTFFTTRRLAFCEIRGRHEYETSDSDGVRTQYIRLVPRDPRQRPLELQRQFNFDTSFEDWLRSLPRVQS